MIEPIFYAGIIISLTWMIATLIVKEKKRKILMILGVVACLVLLLYTRQWKLFVYGIIGGLLFGSVGIGYRQDKLRELRLHTGYELGKLIWEGCKKYIKLTKNDINNNVVEGVEFGLYRDDENIPLETKVTGLDGTVLFEGLPRGTKISGDLSLQVQTDFEDKSGKNLLFSDFAG